MDNSVRIENEDKRRAPRKVCRFLPVDYVVEDRLFHGLIMDLSTTGARIENTLSFLPGASATMTFMEPSSLGPVKTRATVVRAFDNGFAVHFDGLAPQHEDSISGFVSMD